jgi:hypothetical protein
MILFTQPGLTNVSWAVTNPILRIVRLTLSQTDQLVCPGSVLFPSVLSYQIRWCLFCWQEITYFHSCRETRERLSISLPVHRHIWSASHLTFHNSVKLLNSSRYRSYIIQHAWFYFWPMLAHINSNWCIPGTGIVRRPDFCFGWSGNAFVQAELHYHIRCFIPEVNFKLSISTQKHGSYVFLTGCQQETNDNWGFDWHREAFVVTKFTAEECTALWDPTDVTLQTVWIGVHSRNELTD